MKDSFQRKTYGRIFVQKTEDIEIVEKTIAEVDEFEVSYMPKNLVTVYNIGERNDLVYLHKFEICKVALTRACINKGTWIWCVDNGMDMEAV